MARQALEKLELYPSLAFRCPTCGRAIGEACVSGHGNWVQPHIARRRLVK
jgi:hypothetical protein